MRRVPTEPRGEPWISWKVRADAASEDLIRKYERGEPVRVDGQLYKEQRLALLETFHYKCGYCEVLITASDHLGDVEHYRPKARVTDEKGKLVFIEPGRLHPGYFWLAYKWDNLFPTCIACNRPGAGPSGAKSGKWDSFPVVGFRATKPGEETREVPLLLNPWYDDPNDHLTFEDELGIIGTKTERGFETVRILGLNRDGLIESRQKAIRAIKFEFLESQRAFQQEDQIRYDKAALALRCCISGASPFSAVCEAAILKEKRRAEQFLGQF